MADIRTFLSLAGLTQYDLKIKEYITNADLTVMGKVSAAQAEIDALETLVGALPEGTTAKDVIEYINLKTTGIATDEALSQLNETVEAIDEAVKAIEADYLVKADKEALEALISTEEARAKAAEEANAAAIKTEKERSEGIDTDHETRIAAIEADYLVEADKTELAGAINTEKERAMAAEKVNSDAIAVLNGSVTTEGSVAKQVADAVAGILDGAPEAYDTLNEIALWIADHPESVAAINASIKENSDAIDALETFVGTLPEGETSANVVAFIQKLMAAEEERATGAESGLDLRIDSLEALIGTSGDTVAKQIEDAVAGVQANVDKLEETVNTKAAQADLETAVGRIEDAEGEIDQLQTDLDAAEELLATKAAQSDVEALQGDMGTAKADIEQLKTDVDAVEENKADKTALEAATGRLTTAEGNITNLQGRMTTVEGAVATKAEQADLNALDGRVGTAEGEIDTLQTEMDAVEAKTAANETAIGGHETRIGVLETASHTHGNKGALDLVTEGKITAWDAAEGNAKAYAKEYADGLNTAMDTRVAANAAAIAEFKEITTDEVNGLFA